MSNETRVPDARGAVHVYNGDGEYIRKEFPSGGVYHYEDGKLVRAEFPDGEVWHYKDGGHVRTEFPDGEVVTYD